jgi:hypothetical protein
MGLMMIRCGMAMKRMGMLGVSVRKMKTLTVKMETVTLIGKGRYNLTRFMYEGYPESKFRWAIKKKTRIHHKPCILPFDVRIVHKFSP